MWLDLNQITGTSRLLGNFPKKDSHNRNFKETPKDDNQ